MLFSSLTQAYRQKLVERLFRFAERPRMRSNQPAFVVHEKAFTNHKYSITLFKHQNLLSFMAQLFLHPHPPSRPNVEESASEDPGNANRSERSAPGSSPHMSSVAAASRKRNLGSGCPEMI